MLSKQFLFAAILRRPHDTNLLHINTICSNTSPFGKSMYQENILPWMSPVNHNLACQLTIDQNQDISSHQEMVYCLVPLQPFNQSSGGSWGMVPRSGSTRYFLVLDGTKIPSFSSRPSIILIHSSSASTNPVVCVRSSSALSLLFSYHLPPFICCCLQRCSKWRVASLSSSAFCFSNSASKYCRSRLDAYNWSKSRHFKSSKNGLLSRAFTAF